MKKKSNRVKDGHKAVEEKHDGDPIPSYKAAGLSKSWLAWVERRQALKQVTDEAEEELKGKKNPDTGELEGGLNDRIGEAMALKGFDKVMTEKYRVSVTEGSNSYVSRTKLLELGVSAEVITKAEITTTFTSLRVTEIEREPRQPRQARSTR